MVRPEPQSITHELGMILQVCYARHYNVLKVVIILNYLIHYRYANLDTIYRYKDSYYIELHNTLQIG